MNFEVAGELFCFVFVKCYSLQEFELLISMHKQRKCKVPPTHKHELWAMQNKLHTHKECIVYMRMQEFFINVFLWQSVATAFTILPSHTMLQFLLVFVFNVLDRNRFKTPEMIHFWVDNQLNIGSEHIQTAVWQIMIYCDDKISFCLARNLVLDAAKWLCWCEDADTSSDKKVPIL